MAPKAKSGGESPKKAPTTPAASAKEGKKTSTEGAPPGPRPNKEEFEKRIDAVQASIDKKKEEIKKIGDTIESKSTGKKEYDDARTALFDEMKEIKARKEALFQQKQDLLKAGRDEREEAFQAKRKLQDMEKAGKDLNEESLDAKIGALEYQLNVRTKPLSLKEEKAILKQIKDLKAQKPAAIKHTKELEALKAGSSSAVEGATPGASREESIEQLNEKLNAIKGQTEGISKKLDKLKEEREKKLGNLAPLIEKRNALRDEQTTLINQKKDIVNERKQAFELWKEFEQKQREERKKREEEEWAKWKAEQAAEQAKADLEKPNPFISEVTLLEQTIDYCKGLLPQSAESKSDDKPLEYNNPEGYVVMASKKDRAAEMYMEMSKGKKGKKGMKNMAPKEDGPREIKTSKPLKHTAETFTIFKTLEVSTPMVLGDIPALQATLEKKLEAVNAKVKVWEAERLAKVEAAKRGEVEEEEKQE